MGRTPYTCKFEFECEEAQRKAEKFFKTLLERAHKLPHKKVMMKAPAALAACYAVATLMDDHQGHEALLVSLGTMRRLFNDEVEASRGRLKKKRKK